MRASPAAVEWLEDFYRAVDGRHYDELADFLHEDCRSCYPTGAVVEGRNAVLRATRRSLDALSRTRHQLRQVWQEGHELVFELEVTFWRKDGQEITRPGVGVFVLDDGRISEQRLFVDARGVWD